MHTPTRDAARTPSAPRKTWTKPAVRVHGDLAELTRAKDLGGTDSGLGTPQS